MPEIDELDAYDVVEQHWPYDGPHSRDTVLEAARAVSGLVRYLNNATQPGTARYTLEWANTIDSVVSNVKSAVYGLDQLLDQLSSAAKAAAEDPTIYDANSPRPEDRTAEGARIARELADQLQAMRQSVAVWEGGYRVVGGLAHQFDTAHSLSARLGNQ